MEEWNNVISWEWKHSFGNTGIAQMRFDEPWVSEVVIAMERIVTACLWLFKPSQVIPVHISEPTQAWQWNFYPYANHEASISCSTKWDKLPANSSSLSFTPILQLKTFTVTISSLPTTHSRKQLRYMGVYFMRTSSSFIVYCVDATDGVFAPLRTDVG